MKCTHKHGLGTLPLASFHSLLLSVKSSMWEGRGSTEMLKKQGKDSDGMGEGEDNEERSCLRMARRGRQGGAEH